MLCVDLVLIAAIALLGGTIQTVIGFGGGIVIMMILPFFLDMLHASAVSSASLLFLNYSLAFRFRSSISFRRLPLPLLIYIPCSAFAIFLAASLDLEVLVLVFGVFLIVLALYFMFADGRFTVRDSIPAAVVCSAISGLSSGLFGIGGPLMSVYFLSNSKSKEEYTGTIQLFFACTATVNLLIRIGKGIFTPALVPFTLVSMLGIAVGIQLGLRILRWINISMLTNVIYVALGATGVFTILSHLP